jgi:hypothetical protein
MRARRARGQHAEELLVRVSRTTVGTRTHVAAALVKV